MNSDKQTAQQNQIIEEEGADDGPPQVSKRTNNAAMSESTKSKMVISLCAISFMSNASFSQMSPFYPLKAKEKGVTPVYVGFVFGNCKELNNVFFLQNLWARENKEINHQELRKQLTKKKAT